MDQLQAELEAALQSCLTLPDGEDALECAKFTLKDAPDGLRCKPHFWLLTQKGCPFCEEERVNRADDLKSGAITEVDVHTPEGRELAEKNNIDFTPALILVDCDGKMIEKTSEPAA